MMWRDNGLSTGQYISDDKGRKGSQRYVGTWARIPLEGPCSTTRTCVSKTLSCLRQDRRFSCDLKGWTWGNAVDKIVVVLIRFCSDVCYCYIVRASKNRMVWSIKCSKHTTHYTKHTSQHTRTKQRVANRPHYCSFGCSNRQTWSRQASPNIGWEVSLLSELLQLTSPSTDL